MDDPPHMSRMTMTWAKSPAACTAENINLVVLYTIDK